MKRHQFSLESPAVAYDGRGPVQTAKLRRLTMPTRRTSSKNCNAQSGVCACRSRSQREGDTRTKVGILWYLLRLVIRPPSTGHQIHSLVLEESKSRDFCSEPAKSREPKLADFFPSIVHAREAIICPVTIRHNKFVVDHLGIEVRLVFQVHPRSLQGQNIIMCMRYGWRLCLHRVPGLDGLVDNVPQFANLLEELSNQFVLNHGTGIAIPVAN